MIKNDTFSCKSFPRAVIVIDSGPHLGSSFSRLKTSCTNITKQSK